MKMYENNSPEEQKVLGKDIKEFLKEAEEHIKSRDRVYFDKIKSIDELGVEDEYGNCLLVFEHERRWRLGSP